MCAWDYFGWKVELWILSTLAGRSHHTKKFQELWICSAKIVPTSTTKAICSSRYKCCFTSLYIRSIWRLFFNASTSVVCKDIQNRKWSPLIMKLIFCFLLYLRPFQSFLFHYALSKNLYTYKSSSNLIENKCRVPIPSTYWDYIDGTGRHASGLKFSNFAYKVPKKKIDLLYCKRNNTVDRVNFVQKNSKRC